MKIIIDENISSRLIPSIQHIFPNVEHVKSLGLMTTNDFAIFMFARQNGYDAILTLDEDYFNIHLRMVSHLKSSGYVSAIVPQIKCH